MKIDIKHIAKLANLPLKDSELVKLEKQLEETLKYVSNLDEVDTKGVEPTSQVTGLENVTRQDLSKPSDKQVREEILAAAPIRQRHFIKI